MRPVNWTDVIAGLVVLGIILALWLLNRGRKSG
jgi:hypothetical protein